MDDSLQRKFVSQDELDDKRKKRQEEWDKVRTADQPVEAPEEEVDNRSLFEKLQEQKNKKQEEYEQQFSLKNQVKGLEDDEAEFLDKVSDKQMEIEQRREKEEREMLNEFRNSVVNKVSSAPEPELKPKKSLTSVASTSSASQSQKKLLAGAVKRKGTQDDSAVDKRAKSDEAPCSSSTPSLDQPSNGSQSHTDLGKQSPPSANKTIGVQPSGAKVVGILPGLGSYSSDSSDSNTSDSEIDDVVFRKQAMTQLVAGQLQQLKESG